MKRNTRIALYSITIILLIITLGVLSIRTYRHYNLFKDHQDWVDGDNEDVESWMTTNMVIRFYEIDGDQLFEVLKTENSWYNRRLTISDIIERNNLNETQALEEINKLK